MSPENLTNTESADEALELRIKKLDDKIARLRLELDEAESTAKALRSNTIDPEIVGLFRGSNKTDMLRDMGETNAN